MKATISTSETSPADLSSAGELQGYFIIEQVDLKPPAQLLAIHLLTWVQLVNNNESSIEHVE